MPDSPQTAEESSATAAKRGIRWDALAAIIAALIGLLALIVAGYTAYIQRQQVSAQVWPYLLGGFSGTNHEVIWVNKGVGPAIVRSVQVTVDGKSQADWGAVLKSLGMPDAKIHQSTLNDNVVSPGETVEWLIFQNSADYDKFRSVESRVRFKVCYCSTLGDCWVNDATRKDGNTRHEVRQCPTLPAAQQFRD